MVTMKITNDDPLGLYVVPVFLTNSTLDKTVQLCQTQTNQAIKHYASSPANRTNCQTLQNYLKEYQARLVCSRDSEAKFELSNKITNLIDTLQTGIDREPAHTDHTYETEEKKSGWFSFGERYQKCLEQFRVNGYQYIPIVTDTTKLEGYIRSIPNIGGMDVFEFLKKYFYDHLLNFVRPTPQEANQMKNGNSEKYVDRAIDICIKRFAFVQLTSTKGQNVVLDMSEDYED